MNGHKEDADPHESPSLDEKLLVAGSLMFAAALLVTIFGG